MGLRNRSLYQDYNCFFVTTTCLEWKPIIQLSDTYTLLEESLAFVNFKYKVSTLGYVIMPNHIHTLVYFQEKNHLSDYMRDFKKFTSTKMRQELDIRGLSQTVDSLRVDRKNRVFQVWNDRFDDKCVIGKNQLEKFLDYIHLNPLQHHWNLVSRPEDYKFSSACFYESNIQPNLDVTDYRTYF